MPGLRYICMSLTTLKRTLAQMDAAQMADLITDLYKSRPEAKDYLDFFVQPDIDKRMERAKMNIKKELTRTSRGRNRGRSTRVRRYIKDITSLNPGAEPVLDIMTYAVVTACKVGEREWVKETTQRAVGRLLSETLQLANAEGYLNVYLPQIEEAVNAMNGSSFYVRGYRDILNESLRETLESL